MSGAIGKDDYERTIPLLMERMGRLELEVESLKQEIKEKKEEAKEEPEVEPEVEPKEEPEDVLKTPEAAKAVPFYKSPEYRTVKTYASFISQLYDSGHDFHKGTIVKVLNACSDTSEGYEKYRKVVVEKYSILYEKVMGEVPPREDFDVVMRHLNLMDGLPKDDEERRARLRMIFSE